MAAGCNHEVSQCPGNHSGSASRKGRKGWDERLCSQLPRCTFHEDAPEWLFLRLSKPSHPSHPLRETIVGGIHDIVSRVLKIDSSNMADVYYASSFATAVTAAETEVKSL